MMHGSTNIKERLCSAGSKASQHSKLIRSQIMQFAVGCEYLHLWPRSQEFIENYINTFKDETQTAL